MKLYTLDGYVFVCPCAVMRLNRILRFDTCWNPQTKYWSCNHPETFKIYIILYYICKGHCIAWQIICLGLLACHHRKCPSTASRWPSPAMCKQHPAIAETSWHAGDPRPAAPPNFLAAGPPALPQQHAAYMQCICRRIPPWHCNHIPKPLMLANIIIDNFQSHYIAVANMHSSKTRTNQVLSFQPPRTYDFFGIYWDLNFQQGFVWGLHQSSDLWHSKNKDMAGDWGWLLPLECKHEQKANRPSEVHAPKEKPLPRDPKITLQMSAAGWTPLLQSHITFVFLTKAV